LVHPDRRIDAEPNVTPAHVAMSPNAATVRQSPLACIALGVALLALGLAVLPGEVIDPPPRTTIGLKSLVKALTSTEASPELVAHEARMRGYRIALIVSALGAIGLAIVGAARRENRVLTIAAAALAGLALTWQYVLVGIGVAVLVAILFAFIAGAAT
jgi:hypothetical protein